MPPSCPSWRPGMAAFGLALDGLNRWNDGRNYDFTAERSSGLLDGSNADSLFQDDRGRIWVSTLRGVGYLENGRFISVSAVPGGTCIPSPGTRAGISGSATENQGLFHISAANAVRQIPWARLGQRTMPALCSDPVQGGLWLGFYQGGVAYFKDGQVRASYTSAEGLGEGRVTDLQLDRDGTLWAATEGGLSRVKNGRVATLTSKNGLPCDTVHWAMEDDDHSFWLYTACGLVRIARPELDAWAADPKRTIQGHGFRQFRRRQEPCEHRAATAPRVAKSADGKMWFLPLDGVSVIDPRHLPFNKLPPPVHIEQITADRKTYDTSSNLRLPPLIRDLEIDYTALSLVAPEKNRFRVKLEGHDPDWKDVGNRTEGVL